MVLNAYLCEKVGQGHSMSITFINLEDIALNISMSLSSASVRKLQLKPTELCSKSNKRMKSTKIISLLPKQSNRNAQGLKNIRIN